MQKASKETQDQVNIYRLYLSVKFKNEKGSNSHNYIRKERTLLSKSQYSALKIFVLQNEKFPIWSWSASTIGLSWPAFWFVTSGCSTSLFFQINLDSLTFRLTSASTLRKLEKFGVSYSSMPQQNSWAFIPIFIQLQNHNQIPMNKIWNKKNTCNVKPS